MLKVQLLNEDGREISIKEARIHAAAADVKHAPIAAGESSLECLNDSITFMEAQEAGDHSKMAELMNNYEAKWGSRAEATSDAADSGYNVIID